jgi:hypothetical protein
MMLYRMLMRLVGPWRIRLTRLHWWCWRKLVARRFPLPRTNVRSATTWAQFEAEVRERAAKLQGERA